MTDWKDDREQSPYEEPAGTGKVLFYFFAVVVLCAVSVGIGYLMGRRTTPPAGDVTASSSPTPLARGASKPGAVREAAEPTETPDAAEASPSPTPRETKASTKPEKPAPGSKTAAKTPEVAASLAKGFMVQVAAVTRQEDADTLASALRKKQYPVFVLPAAGADKYFHVQVGPFAEMKDAEAMKSKLAADGYNAIVKK